LRLCNHGKSALLLKCYKGDRYKSDDIECEKAKLYS